MDGYTLRWWCDLLANHFRNLGVDKTSHLNRIDSLKKNGWLANWWLNLLARRTSSGHMIIPNGNGQLNLALAVLVSFQYQVYELVSRREWILDWQPQKKNLLKRCHLYWIVQGSWNSPYHGEDETTRSGCNITIRQKEEKRSILYPYTVYNYSPSGKKVSTKLGITPLFCPTDPLVTLYATNPIGHIPPFPVLELVSVLRSSTSARASNPWSCLPSLRTTSKVDSPEKVWKITNFLRTGTTSFKTIQSYFLQCIVWPYNHSSFRNFDIDSGFIWYTSVVIPCLSQHPGCLQHRPEALGMFGTLVDCCWETSFGYPLGRRKGVFQRVETKSIQQIWWIVVGPGQNSLVWNSKWW